jgi:Snf7 protein
MNIVEWAFGKRMTPAERLRKHQRALEKTQRELDRERVKLENQEKKLVADIKKSAKNGQMGPLRIQAKDLVRTRRYICLDFMTLSSLISCKDISKNSIRCGRSCRPFHFGYKQSEAMNK